MAKAKLHFHGVTLARIQEVSAARSARWHRDCEPFTVSDWAVAVAGETGEMCNEIKKMRRMETGARILGDPVTMDAARLRIKKEMADVISYIVLLADELEIDLEDAVIEKFNEVSEREGFLERLQ